jgi:hypothetical protein
MDGIGDGWELMVRNYFCRREAKRTQLDGEMALSERQRAPGMQHLRTLRVMHV